jgi:hypothetical protein
MCAAGPVPLSHRDPLGLDVMMAHSGAYTSYMKSVYIVLCLELALWLDCNTRTLS